MMLFMSSREPKFPSLYIVLVNSNTDVRYFLQKILLIFFFCKSIANEHFAQQKKKNLHMHKCAVNKPHRLGKHVRFHC